MTSITVIQKHSTNHGILAKALIYGEEFHTHVPDEHQLQHWQRDKEARRFLHLMNSWVKNREYALRAVNRLDSASIATIRELNFHISMASRESSYRLIFRTISNQGPRLLALMPINKVSEMRYRMEEILKYVNLVLKVS